MYRILSVTPLGRGRSRVTLQNFTSSEEFALVLYKGELRTFQIREEGELSDADYAKITEEILPKRAILRAMNLLQKKQFTVQELRQKLTDGGYPEAIAEQALSYVASYHYTDDVRYAEDYIRYHAADRGRRRLELELSRKGVSQEDFETAWAQCQELGILDDEQEQILLLLEKKQYSPDLELRERERIFAFLLRRGFSPEAVRRAMKARGETEG